MRETIWPFLLIGIAAGVVSGLLGVGGGIVIVPLLVLVAGITQHEAHATSLLAVVPIAAVGAATYALDGAINWKPGLLVALGAVVGAPLGAGFMAAMRESTLKMLFGGVLFALGAFMVIS
ncbi:MAG: TSUP family transporter [Actinomycetota bacterium]